MHCFQCAHPTVTSGISARPLEATLMSSGSTLSRAALRVVTPIGGPSHPTSYLGHRRMGVKQGRDHVIEARSHHRSIVTQGIIFAQCRTDEAVAETERLKISSKLINVELSPGPSSLCSVDGHFNLDGVKGPIHQPWSDAPPGAGMMSTVDGL